MSYAAESRAPKDGRVIDEGTGEITSDSLAAESLANDGSFADGRASAGSQPSRGTTANNTDTSGATILSSASDRQSRNTDEAQDYQPQSSSYDQAGSGYNTGKGGPQDSYSGDAPSSLSGSNQFSGDMKPKGKNLQEGGFSSDAPNSSFNSDIGSRNDPGRAAEQSFGNANARAGADAGYNGANQSQGRGNQGGFENLQNEEGA